MFTIVFIETNFSGLEAIRYCAERGYQTVLVTDSMERFKRWFPSASLNVLNQTDHIVQVEDSSNTDAVAKALGDNGFSIDAVLTFAEVRTKTAAELAQRLGLLGTSPKAVGLAQDKLAFRRQLLKAGVDTVKTSSLLPDTRLGPGTLSVPLPCFAKPLQGHSSIAARACHSIADIEAVRSALAENAEPWLSDVLVLETLLQGRLLSVEALTRAPSQHEIIGVSDRALTQKSIEIGASFPVLDNWREQVEGLARDALNAIGYDFGASHIEIMLSDDGPHLVEINSRVGGSGHSVMLDLATGRSIVGDAIELYLGRLEPKSPLYGNQQGAAWQCLVSEQPGYITHIPSESEILSLEGVTHVWLHHEDGDFIGGANSNFDWIVQVMCVGEDQGAAKRRAEAAIQYVDRRTELVSEAVPCSG